MCPAFLVCPLCVAHPESQHNMHYDEYVRQRRPLRTTVEGITALAALLGIVVAAFVFYDGRLAAGSTYLLGSASMALAFSRVPAWLGRKVVRHTGTIAMLIVIMWLAALTWHVTGLHEFNAAWFGLGSSIATGALLCGRWKDL